MASSKRDFANFNDFPGSINKANGIYEFPALKTTDDKNRTRNWQIFVRLVKNDNLQTKINWSLSDEKQAIIKPTYFLVGDDYTDLPSGVVAESWTETGLEGKTGKGDEAKTTRSIPSYYDKIANKGKANQRNPFQQALIAARSLYLKKEDRGGNKSNVKMTAKEKKAEAAKKTSQGPNVMYFPMLAKTYKDGKKHITYPVMVQPKLDGVRCLAYLSKKNGDYNDVVMYSRLLNDYPSTLYLKKLLFPYLNEMYDEKNKQSLYLDGELYVHGKKLQDISGTSRRDITKPKYAKLEKQKSKLSKYVGDEDADNADDERDTADTERDTERSIVDDSNYADDADQTASTDNPDQFINKNQYHIYDCFYPLSLNTQFANRHKLVNKIKQLIEDKHDEQALKYIKFVDTVEAATEDDVNTIYNKYIADGYEGVMIRNIAGEYLADPNKTSSTMRSKNLVKMKKKESDEFKIIGFTEGSKGKDKGAIIWVLQTADGHEFNATPKDITYEERYKLYDECVKDFSKYKGLMMTVEYEDLSKTSVPQRAKALVIRNYE